MLSMASFSTLFCQFNQVFRGVGCPQCAEVNPYCIKSWGS